MATVTVSQVPDTTVNVKQFTALEQKVDALVAQLHQLLPQPPSKTKGGRNGLKVGQIPKMPSFNRPLTPESLPATPDIGTPAMQPILNQTDSVAFTERASAKLAVDILDIIQRYGNNAVTGPASWPGKAKFVPMVEAAVVKHEPVQMVLPAFPFKSPNRHEKVLGSLPDLGEELALTHLNGLCASIADIYEHGAKVVITSDGLVYNGEY